MFIRLNSWMRHAATMRPALPVAVAGAVAAAALWWRKHPSACPYGQRFWVEAPHPLITRARLRHVLDPKPGERVLEVGRAARKSAA